MLLEDKKVLSRYWFWQEESDKKTICQSGHYLNADCNTCGCSTGCSCSVGCGGGSGPSCSCSSSDS